LFAPRVARPKSSEPQRPAVAAKRPAEAAVTWAYSLQRTIGRGTTPSWDFSKIPVSSSGSEKSQPLPPPIPAPRLPIQAKLEVGAVDDPLEHEADRVAEQVIRMPAPEVSVAAAPPQVSRKCAECEEEEKLQRKSAGPQATSEAPASVHDVLRSPGQPLDAATRAFFEPRFGHDFTQVRVHRDQMAAASARSVNAKAFTAGEHVVFNDGQFQPWNRDGKRLLAHELSHVVQQRRGTREPVVARQPIDAGHTAEEDEMLNCIVASKPQAGVVSEHETFEACKQKLNYTGPEIFPTDVEWRQITTGEIITKEEAARYATAIKQYKKWREDDLVSRMDQEMVDPQIDLTQQLLAVYVPDLFPTQSDAKVARKEFVPLLRGVAGLAAAAPQRAASSAVRLGATAANENVAVRWGISRLAPSAAEAVVVTEEAAVVGGAAVGTTVLLGAAAVAAAAYLSYRFWEWTQTVPIVNTYPGVPAAIEETIARIGRVIPIPNAQRPVPTPAPLPKPTDQKRRRGKCPYATGRTPDDPIPIRWFKPRENHFYPKWVQIYDGALDRDDPGATVPDGRPVGVQERFWPRLGKVVKLTPSIRLGGQRRFKERLESAGYDWPETEHCDHVQDLQWCGPDDVESGNFWPFEKSINLSAGPTQNNLQYVTFCPSPNGRPAVNWIMQDLKRAGFYGRYFTIQEVRSVSDQQPGLTALRFPPAGQATCEE
jgi:hypothetical protein